MARLLIPLVLLFACTADDEGSEDADSDAPGLIGEDVPWPDKTVEEKQSWMTYRVLPQIEARFEAFDPERAMGFDCSNCHGSENTSDFGSMPHPLGPEALSVSDWPSNSADPDVRAIAAFMEDEIVPDIAALLDTVVAPQPGAEGISCGTCHEITN